MKKLTKKEIKNFLINNCIDENGNLDLSGLDFSDFEGDIDISEMKVKKSLMQNYQVVGETLLQNSQIVKINLMQHNQEVGDTLFQNNQRVKKSLCLQSTNNLEEEHPGVYKNKKYHFENLTLGELKVKRSLLGGYRKIYQDPYKMIKGRKTYTFKNITFEELDEQIEKIEKIN